MEPSNLSKKSFELLNRFARQVNRSPEALLEAAENHLEKARKAYQVNRNVNLSLAEAIVESFRDLVTDWDEIPRGARKWCLGMFRYFTSSNDEIADFDSPIGFEDDAEVVNACLKLANREDLCIDIEYYDEA